jgi:N-acetylglucosaminyldiphosphoundecaprenol N-acetyl-beta-D-mannosaminyltransferase
VMTATKKKPSYPEVRLFGITFSNLTFEGFCQAIDDHVAQQEYGYVVTPNVDHVCRVQSDPLFKQAYDDASLVVPDGVPIIWSSRLLRQPLVEKLSGSDMVPLICAHAAKRGYSVFLLGAAEGVADEAAARLIEKYPPLQVAGTYSPPLGFEEDPEACVSIAARVQDAKADICFVALGSPKQEIWMNRHGKDTGVSVLLGIGAGLDFVAGRVNRAPRWVQRCGFEWLWRLCQEPRRLWRRYLVEDTYFAVLLWRELRQTWRRRNTGKQQH